MKDRSIVFVGFIGCLIVWECSLGEIQDITEKEAQKITDDDYRYYLVKVREARIEIDHPNSGETIGGGTLINVPYVPAQSPEIPDGMCGCRLVENSCVKLVCGIIYDIEKTGDCSLNWAPPVETGGGSYPSHWGAGLNYTTNKNYILHRLGPYHPDVVEDILEPLGIYDSIRIGGSTFDFRGLSEWQEWAGMHLKRATGLPCTDHAVVSNFRYIIWGPAPDCSLYAGDEQACLEVPGCEYSHCADTCYLLGTTECEAGCTEKCIDCNKKPSSYIGDAIKSVIQDSSSEWTQCNTINDIWDTPGVYGEYPLESEETHKGHDFFQMLQDQAKQTQRTLEVATLFGGEFLVEYLRPAILDIQANPRPDGIKPLIRIIVSNNLNFTYDELVKDIPQPWNFELAIAHIGVINWIESLVGTWNHAKMFIRDQMFSVTGGHNFVEEYLFTDSLLNQDISVGLTGEASQSARNFFDRLFELQEYCRASRGLDPMTNKCTDLSQVMPEPVFEYVRTDNVNVFSLGRYKSTKITELDDYSADHAIEAAFDAAQSSINVVQQQLALPIDPVIDRFADMVARATHRGVQVKVVINGNDCCFPIIGEETLCISAQAQARALREQMDVYFDNELLLSDLEKHNAQCNLVFATFATGPGMAQEFNNHHKSFIIDDLAYYIGSQNLYPGGLISYIDPVTRLSEHGYLVDDPDEAIIYKTQFWDNLWKWSRYHLYEYLPILDFGWCSTCGNEVTELGETCDGIDCPTLADCYDGNACTQSTLVGSAAECNVRCGVIPIDTCIDNDQCCPQGCDALSDSDCSSTCGNGLLEPGETCDGDCEPLQLINLCVSQICTGSAENCNLTCSLSLILDCIDNDGCCPGGCKSNVDNDCLPSCGNGIVEKGELCDGNCVAACPDDGNACTLEYTTGSVQNCNVACGVNIVTTCKDNDGCCPTGCNSVVDNDCTPLPSCGNGQIDPRETCDGDCPRSCPHESPCIVGILSGNPENCSAYCTYLPIVSCIDDDDCCPSHCRDPYKDDIFSNLLNDRDCWSLPTSWPCLIGECEPGRVCDVHGCGETEGNCVVPRKCSDTWDPVCGCDGLTYTNSCHRIFHEVALDHIGECKEEEPEEPIVECDSDDGCEEEP